MPAFAKSMILALLIFFQAETTDAALSYVQSTEHPKEWFIVIGTFILLVGIILYLILVRRIFEKDKPSSP